MEKAKLNVIEDQHVDLIKDKEVNEVVFEVHYFIGDVELFHEDVVLQRVFNLLREMEMP